MSSLAFSLMVNELTLLLDLKSRKCIYNTRILVLPLNGNRLLLGCSLIFLVMMVLNDSVVFMYVLILLQVYRLMA